MKPLARELARIADTDSFKNASNNALPSSGAARGDSNMSSHRNRPPRNSNRGSGSTVPEEFSIFEQSQQILRDFESNEAKIEEKRKVHAALALNLSQRDEEGSDKPSSGEWSELEKLTREISAMSEKSMEILTGNNYPVIERLQVVTAIQKEKEASMAENSRRNGRVENSPAPSSAVEKEKSSTLKRVARENRSSLPPVAKSDAGTSAGLDVGNNGVTKNAKGKIVYAKGNEVAFKTTSPTDGQINWFQGEVTSVSGEGKSRRYLVQDIDDLDAAPVRTSASSMVLIPSPDAVLSPYEPQARVLARYPDTTAFYPALVLGTQGGQVTLQFDAEDEPDETKVVDRRFVLDYQPPK